MVAQASKVANALALVGDSSDTSYQAKIVPRKVRL